MRLDPRHRTWAGSDRFVPRAFVRPFLRFTQVEASSGLVLLAAAVVALVWANSPWAEGYHQVFEGTRVVFQVGPVHIDESFGDFVNDGLMCIFFFLVGLEIKRELVVGELREPRDAVLPVAAALGGMILPALIYLSFVAGTGPEAVHGWAIPMATDIAFTVGIIALLGSRIPVAARVFLLALAIADDLGAIVVIAVFYSSDLAPGWLALAAAGLGAIALSQRAGIRSLAFYLPMAVLVWYAMLESGVHATLAGVALAFLTPVRPLYGAAEFEEKARSILDTYPVGSTAEDEERSDDEAALLAGIATESIAPLHRLERKLAPWSAFLVVPLFALANAGVDLRGSDLGGVLTHRVALGVAVGLVVGKTVGISLFTWIAVRLGMARLPQASTWRHLVGLAALAGIGFTVSLFITDLAFGDTPIGDVARVGIFAGSIFAGVAGSVILYGARSRPG